HILQETLKPSYVRISGQDNVAMVFNVGGLPAGTVFSCGLTLRTSGPLEQNRVLQDIARDAPVIRYGVVIGYALCDVAAGAWVNEAMLRMPQAPSLDALPMATRQPGEVAPLTGLTFDGYRNADGTVGTRNILAISATVQCVTGVVEFAVRKIREI